MIDSFFATRIFGPKRLAYFEAQSSTLAGDLTRRDDEKRKRLGEQIGDVDQRIERQLAAIEAGVDPVVVGERIRALKSERAEVDIVLAQLEDARRDSTAVDPADAAAVLSSLPDLGAGLAAADPDVRRAVFDAFRLQVEIDRNASQVRLKAMVSSAFGEAKDLTDLGEPENGFLSTKAIPLRGFEPRFPD